MTVIIAGRAVTHADILTEPTRLTLGFIAGGHEWLAWAAAEPAAHYDYPDETQFVDGVQQGLHGSPFALLPRLGLLVSPVKLLTLGHADLHALARAEAGDDSAALAAQVHAALARNRIATQADLRAGAELLARLGVSTAPLFQALSMADSLALAMLPPLEARPEWQREAAQFALRHARTTPEYCDYYRLYLDRAEQLGGDASERQRDEAADDALGTLLPLLFGALDCPQVDGLVSPAAVALVVARWLAHGRRLGFLRLSLGVQQIVRHGGYHGETGHAARHLVETYLGAAHVFLGEHRVEHGLMGQDGATCVFPVEGPAQHAVLRLSRDGVISLAAFGAKRDAAPRAG